MRIKIGNYINYFGPYQLAEFLCFWARNKKDEHGIPDKPDYVHNFGEWLAYGDVRPEPEVGEVQMFRDNREYTWIARFLNWIHSKKKRTIKVHIDRWDTWSMDHTLAFIILPMLKQLKETNHGVPFVDDEDVPEELRSTAAEPKKNDWDLDSNGEKRWEWVMNEMIFAFENKVRDDSDDEFSSGDAEYAFKKLDNGCSELIQTNDQYKYDFEARKKKNDRIQNGFVLFGKYFQNLWD